MTVGPVSGYPAIPFEAAAQTYLSESIDALQIVTNWQLGPWDVVDWPLGTQCTVVPEPCATVLLLLGLASATTGLKLNHEEGNRED